MTYSAAMVQASWECIRHPVKCYTLEYLLNRNIAVRPSQNLFANPITWLAGSLKMRISGTHQLSSANGLVLRARPIVAGRWPCSN